MITLDAHGLRAAILPQGAALARLWAPDRDGVMANVALGLPDAADYRAGHPYLGVLVGRWANRIAGARFALDGRAHRLAANEGPTCLHGGPGGISWRDWAVLDAAPDAATLRLVSPDGDGGFPGTVTITARWSLEAPMTLRLEVTATTDAPTVLNIAHHGYWNLAGEGAGDVRAHELSIAAARYLPVDAALIPTGEVAPVAGTPFDFRAATPVGARLAGRYDHCWALDGTAPACVLHDPASGRAMAIETDQPGLQLYGGQGLDGRLRGPAGRPYFPHAGLALEPQNFPDAPNRPGFPDGTLRPDGTYRQVTRWRFACR